MQGELALGRALARLTRERLRAIGTYLPTGLERTSATVAYVTQLDTTVGASDVVTLHWLAATGTVTVIGELPPHELKVHDLLGGVGRIERRTQQTIGNQASDGHNGNDGP